MSKSFQTKDDKYLLDIVNKLEVLNKKKKDNIILYWLSYTQFQLSIYYYVNNDFKELEKAIDKGIIIITKIINKSSEDYALLANLQSFSLQFKKSTGMFIFPKIKNNLKKAIELDPTNLRAYYVSASFDYYTPKMFGGGKKTEELLLKAIELPAQKIKNDLLPYWGKDDSYAMLINLYLSNKENDKAKKYFDIAVKEFPNSYMINQLSSKINL